jgi:hypothetical protein
MKTGLILGLALTALAPAQAEVFRSGVAQSHSHNRSHDNGSRGDGRHDGHDTRVHIGVGHGSSHAAAYWGGHRHYGGASRYYSNWYLGPAYYGGYYGRGYGYYPSEPVYSYYDGYGAGYPYYSTGTYRTEGATSGLLLGALAGGIIGHNSGEFRHNGWRGAAWGAGVGWLLGTMADANRRHVSYAQPIVTQPAVVQSQLATQVQAQPQPVTIINNYYNSATPMSGANNLFGR